MSAERPTAVKWIVARRKLTALRVAAAVSFLFSITVPLSWPVTLTTLILTFRGQK